MFLQPISTLLKLQHKKTRNLMILEMFTVRRMVLNYLSYSDSEFDFNKIIINSL